MEPRCITLTLRRANWPFVAVALLVAAFAAAPPLATWWLCRGALGTTLAEALRTFWFTDLIALSLFAYAAWQLAATVIVDVDRVAVRVTLMPSRRTTRVASTTIERFVAVVHHYRWHEAKPSRPRRGDAPMPIEYDVAIVRVPVGYRD